MVVMIKDFLKRLNHTNHPFHYSWESRLFYQQLATRRDRAELSNSMKNTWGSGRL